MSLVLDVSFGAAHRIELDATSWVEHVPGWLADSEQLLAGLIANVAWEQRERWMVNRMVTEPRLTAEYNNLASAPEEALRVAAAALSAQYGVTYDGLWINYYRNHRDSTGWHGDWPTCKRTVCIVPVLSLGATRRFLIKPRGGGKSVGLSPASGDLIVMGGRCQRDWLHCVPKQDRPAGPRISVNFSSTHQATREPAGPAGSQRSPRGSCDVIKVVDRVVNEVAGERLHREAGAVAARAGALPLVTGYRREPVRDGPGRRAELVRDHERVLFPVAFRDGRLVLIPVREQRVVLGEHQLEPEVVEPQHVPDVAAILQRRPPVRRRPDAHAGLTREDITPGGRVRQDHRRDLLARERAGIEAAVRARPPQHPGPVLRVGDDRHTQML